MKTNSGQIKKKYGETICGRCAENKNESPTNKVWLSHGKTTAAQLPAVEKERDY